MCERQLQVTLIAEPVTVEPYNPVTQQSMRAGPSLNSCTGRSEASPRKKPNER